MKVNAAKPTGEQFRGRASEMRESPWLSSEDLIGLGDVTLTIEDVRRYENLSFAKGRKKPQAYGIKFAGAARELILNGTNRVALMRAYGIDVTDWIGKPITLYIDHTQLAGQSVPCIRFRPLDKGDTK